MHPFVIEGIAKSGWALLCVKHQKNMFIKRHTKKTQNLSFALWISREFQENQEADLDGHYFKTLYEPSAVSPEILEVNNRNIKAQMQSLKLIDSKGQATMISFNDNGEQSEKLVSCRLHSVCPGYEPKEITDPLQSQKEISGVLQNRKPKAGISFGSSYLQPCWT